ncbi:hypothetical protein NDU88_002982 [Pleurodeles waltl]|uniref:Uncharacterized protein n=1 Tax=Pleurodeles waltl TaxID=8319 RepID=A0AAV7W3P4_PLEWA|nr:hypothetical protein NDU88_002982 [Pleurodeles waltl]
METPEDPTPDHPATTPAEESKSLEAIVAPSKTPAPDTPDPHQKSRTNQNDGKTNKWPKGQRQGNPATAQAREQCLNKMAALKKTPTKETGLSPEDPSSGQGGGTEKGTRRNP